MIKYCGIDGADPLLFQVGYTSVEFDRLREAFNSVSVARGGHVADATPRPGAGAGGGWGGAGGAGGAGRVAPVSLVWMLTKRSTTKKATCKGIRLTQPHRCKRPNEEFRKGSWTLSVKASYHGPRFGESGGTRHDKGTDTMVYFCANQQCVSVTALSKHSANGLALPPLTWPVLLIGEAPSNVSTDPGVISESDELMSLGVTWSR